MPSTIRRTGQVNELRPEEHSHPTFHNLRMRQPQRPRMIPYGVADLQRQVHRNPALGGLVQVRRKTHRRSRLRCSLNSSRLSLSQLSSLFSFTMPQLLRNTLSLRQHTRDSRSLAGHNDNLLKRPTYRITPPTQANQNPAAPLPNTTTRRFQPPPGPPVPTRRHSTHASPHRRVRRD